VFFILLATIGPIIVPAPIVTSVNPKDIFLPPQLNNPYYILGTGPIGDSILGDIVAGAPFLLEVAFLAGLFSTAIGLTIGILSGYLGGIMDMILTSITNIVMTMPSLILVIILVTMIRTSNPLIISLILSISSWTGLALSVRSQVLVLRSLPYIEVNKLLGLGTWHTVFREIFPNLASYIAIHFIFNVEGAVYAAVGLYFLGLLPINPYNWGVMISNALNDGAVYGGSALYYLLFPSVFVVMFMVGLIFLTYGIDEISNPRLRRY
ncbi:ABC transporter permease, partial [Acidianus sp. RZ1]|uniref:ABC transporter permease n=1 Tax=Acidianus sp. RZ1 TaxID=1540082 RepID=UPI00149231B7